jgi:hypothetical protein
LPMRRFRVEAWQLRGRFLMVNALEAASRFQ